MYECRWVSASAEPACASCTARSLSGRAAATARRIRQTWASDESLSSQYSTPVVHRGHLYGTHGREDVGVAALRCVELATGKVKWSEEGFGVAHPLLVGDKLLLQTVDGRILVAAANPERMPKPYP